MEFARRQISDSSGQSIVEVIIAVAILSTAVASSLTLTTASLTAQKENEGYMIGTNLAREGIEVARNLRDSNWLADQEWNGGLYGADNDYTAIPVFDPNSGEWSLNFFPEVLGELPTQIWRYTADHIGTYVQAASQPANTVATRYYRVLALDPICKDQSVVISGSACPALNPQVGIRVKSMVSWKSSGRDRYMEAIEMMYDWR